MQLRGDTPLFCYNYSEVLIMVKVFDRIFQFIFYVTRPLLPWREPKILNNYDGLSEELKKQEKKRVLICIDDNLLRLGIHEALIADLSLHGIQYDYFSDISPSPTISQVENAVIKYHRFKADAIIGFGGGSSLDVAKALGARIVRPQKSLTKMGGLFKVRKKLPFLAAVPTTAGTGSEATLAAVIVDEKTKRKYAINDFVLIPHFALLVPDLTLSLPAFLTATTGMDTLTHAVEAFTNNGGTRFTNAKAVNAVRLVFKYLPIAYINPLDYEARENLQIAAYDAGVAFTRNYVGYVHALSHPLSAFYGLPHGYANALILPFMLEKYGTKVYKKIATLARLANECELGQTDEETAKEFIHKIRTLNKQFKIPTTVPEISEKDIPQLAKYANKEARPLYPTPRIFATKELEEFYHELKGETQ